MSRGVRVAVGVVAVALAVAFFALLRATRPVPDRVGPDVALLGVRAMVVEPVGVQRSWNGHGAVRPLRSALVAAEVGGVVVERPETIEDGVRVSAGDLLVRIDPRDYRTDLTSAERRAEGLEAQLAALDVEAERLGEQLELAQEDVALQQREVQRVREATAAGAATDLDLDRAVATLTRARRELAAVRQALDLVAPRRRDLDAQLRAARAEAERAEVNLQRTEIRSPIDGFIQEMRVEAGERLAPGQTVARIVTLTRLEVPLQVPVSAAASLAAGDAVSLRHDGPSGAEWEGRVARVSPEADVRTRSVTAYVLIEQEVPPAGVGEAESALLLPGQYVTGRVHTSRRAPQIVVPRRAVVADEVFVLEEVRADGGTVYRVRALPVVVEGHVAGEFPQLDALERQWAVVVEGLEPGILVAVSNLDVLREGLAVRLLEEAPAAEARGS